MSRVPLDLRMGFDEIEAGDAMELGSYSFTAEEIIAFARKFDPQPFHLSDEAAAKTHFGRLSASGWHTAAIWMKLMIAWRDRQIKARQQAGLSIPLSGPSPGFTDMRWLKPVRAGDTISYRSEVTGKRTLASRPDYGLVESINQGHNQEGDLVFEFKGRYFAKREKA